MGWFLRKSVSVGPFRFNLSGSGVGMSVGVKGFRVGTGPRGNYVHLGRGGVYYRHTFSPKDPQPRPAMPMLPISGTHTPLQEVESAGVANIVDPDRRFAVNPQIPICLYDELVLRTPSGLNEIVQVSRSGVGDGFAAAVRYLGNVTA